jgi:hypothetical protein
MAYDVFFPRKHPPGFPSMAHRFPRAPFSMTHDLPAHAPSWAIPSILQFPKLLHSREGLLTTCGAGLLVPSPPQNGLTAASWAVTFWICAACSFTVAVRISIPDPFSDAECEKVALSRQAKLPGVVNQLQHGLAACFKLRAHLLQTRGKRFNLLSLLCNLGTTTSSRRTRNVRKRMKPFWPRKWIGGF